MTVAGDIALPAEHASNGSQSTSFQQRANSNSDSKGPSPAAQALPSMENAGENLPRNGILPKIGIISTAAPPGASSPMVTQAQAGGIKRQRSEDGPTSPRGNTSPLGLGGLGLPMQAKKARLLAGGAKLASLANQMNKAANGEAHAPEALAATGAGLEEPAAVIGQSGHLNAAERQASMHPSASLLGTARMEMEGGTPSSPAAGQSSSQGGDDGLAEDAMQPTASAAPQFPSRPFAKTSSQRTRPGSGSRVPDWLTKACSATDVTRALIDAGQTGLQAFETPAPLAKRAKGLRLPPPPSAGNLPGWIAYSITAQDPFMLEKCDTGANAIACGAKLFARSHVRRAVQEAQWLATNQFNMSEFACRVQTHGAGLPPSSADMLSLDERTQRFFRVGPQQKKEATAVRKLLTAHLAVPLGGQGRRPLKRSVPRPPSLKTEAGPAMPRYEPSVQHARPGQQAAPAKQQRSDSVGGGGPSKRGRPCWKDAAGPAGMWPSAPKPLAPKPATSSKTPAPVLGTVSRPATAPGTSAFAAPAPEWPVEAQAPAAPGRKAVSLNKLGKAFSGQWWDEKAWQRLAAMQGRGR